VEGVKHGSCFVHILEDPFVVLLEEVSSTNVLDFLRIGFMDGVLNELSKNLWYKQVQRKQTTNKMLLWLHWTCDFA
jgi:hypothetical protein